MKASTKPRLSFLVPVYNPPPSVLTEALASIASQTLAEWECVLVDDRSTDPSVAAELAAWAARDPRFRVVTRDRNGGIAAATNDAIEHAQAAIVAFVDHDDVVIDDAAQTIIDHFAKHLDDDVVYSDEQLIDAAGHVIAEYHKPVYSPIRHLGHHYLAHLVAMRRSAVGDLRVRTEFEPAQDVDFSLRVIERSTAHGRHVGHIPSVLYQWRAIAGSTAMEADEKPGTIDAVERSIADALARRGLTASIEPATFDGRPTTSMRLRFPSPPGHEIEHVDLDDTDVASIARSIETTQARFVQLVGSRAISRENTLAVAAEVTRTDVAIAGPALVTPAGMIASAGRLVAPTLHDAAEGEERSVGSFGAYLVTREVSAVAPFGAVLDVEAVRGVGGLPDDVGLDAALAELSERLRRLGRSTVWTPNAELVVDAPLITDPDSTFDDWARCAHRLGDVSEDFDTLGRQRWLGRPAPALVHARELIATGSVDLVTSDVFDTVVTRHVATPSDLFIRLGEELQNDGLLPEGITPRRFALARAAAERAARVRVADAGDGRFAPECTLSEIWAEMPAGWLTAPAAGVARELDVEARNLHPIEPAIAVLRAAVDAGIPTVLVSDTYLSPDELRELLDRCGALVAGTSVVTSSEHRQGKADGLLQRVIEERSVAPERVLHIGDNAVADIATATELGATAVHVDLPQALRAVEIPFPALASYSDHRGTDGGITAAQRALFVREGTDGCHPAYQFGVASAGPAMAGFARWASATTRELGAGALHCLLREGRTIADLVTVVDAHAPNIRVVHASRWVDMRAAVINGDVDELYAALARRGPTSTAHVAEAFGVPADQVCAVWEGADLLDAQSLRRGCVQIAEDESLRAEIVRAAAILRQAVIAQLRQEIDPAALAGSCPLVVCDVGWGATIQSGLGRILAAEGFDVRVVGLYLALSDPGENRTVLGIDARSYLPSALDGMAASEHSRAIAHHADSVERLLMPAEGTLVDVAPDGTPILTDGKRESQPPSLLAAKRGMFDVATELASQGFDDDVWLRDLDFRGALASTLAAAVSNPSSSLARDLASWPHDDVAGVDAQAPSTSRASALVRYATVREVAILQRSEHTWIEGLAALANPPLAAQLAAGRAGVDLGDLVPSASAGPSRIAAFPIGSDLASVQIEHHAGESGDGWSVVTIGGPTPTLRSVRFDAATRPVLVEIERLSITLSDEHSTIELIEIVDLDDDSIEWVGAWPIGPRRFVETAGGHVLVRIDPHVGAIPCRVDVAAVFRRWSLNDDDPMLRPSVKWRATTATRRVRRAVERRIR